MPIRVQSDDFDFAAEIAQLRLANPKIGAIVSFLGTVRDVNDDNAVTQMELEHYPGMTEKALSAIVTQAKQRWNIVDALVIHRIGRLLPIDQIVLVAVASAHRGEAFSACEFIIDYLKTEAPFWKKEYTVQGTRWVDARVTDEDALAKWEGEALPLPIRESKK